MDILNSIFNFWKQNAWLQNFVSGIIGAILVILTKFGEKKFENLANKQDLEELTAKVESVKTIYQKEIEGYKAQLEQRKLVSRVQFEKEFQIYSEIWTSLIDMRTAAYNLRPLYEGNNPPTFTEKSSEFNKAFEKYWNVIEKNQPFYNEQIYSKLKDIRALVHKEGREAAMLPIGKDMEYYIQGMKNVDEIINQTYEVCKAIRERISGIEVLQSSKAVDTP